MNHSAGLSLIAQYLTHMIWDHDDIFSTLLALCAGEFPSQKPVTQSFDAFFDLHLNKWLSKQLWG